MPGNRDDVAAMQARLDATFKRVADLPSTDLEVQSDFARYLCILVSGFVENAVAALTIAYCRKGSQPTVANYAGTQLSKLRNLNSEKLLQVVKAFEPQWGEELSRFIDGPRKDALDSVLGLRNQIAHGVSVGLTYVRIKEYYTYAKQIISFIEDHFK